MQLPQSVPVPLEGMGTHLLRHHLSGERIGRRHPRPHAGDHSDHWLSTLDTDPHGLLVPFPAAAMKMWPISARVNKPENDDWAILEPVEAQDRPPLL